MPASVLIAYATNYGSTQEVAEAVAATLREGGLEVTVQPARQVRSLGGYGAVVLGAPLYMFRWHKDARRFLARHQKALAGRSVAVFAVGPAFKGDEEEFRGARDQLDKALAEFPWLEPAERVVFGGKFDPAGLRFPYKLMIGKLPALDLRDWPAIRAWAAALPETMRSKMTPPRDSVIRP